MKKKVLKICAVLTLCLLALSYSKNAPTRVAAANNLTVAPAMTVPLYELYADSTGMHFYTANEARKADAVAHSWRSSKVACYVFSKQVPGTVPLYMVGRVVNIENSSRATFDAAQFLYTTTPAEFTQMKQMGWSVEGTGVVCFIAAKQLPGTVPLYRLFHPVADLGFTGGEFSQPGPSSGDYYYTTSQSDMAEATKYGWEFVRIEGYVWPQPTTLDESAGSGQSPRTMPATSSDEQLFSVGCAQTPGQPGEITCLKPSGYFLCESLLKEGKLKAKSCKANFNLNAFNAMEKELFGFQCTRAIGLYNSYNCPTWTGYNACEKYLMTGNGLVAMCISPKKYQMDQELTKNGCKAGTPGNYTCSTPAGLNVCNGYLADKHVKSCTPASNK